jgi:hypothetical protein
MSPPLPKNEEEMDAYLKVLFQGRTREQWIESLLRLRLSAEDAKLRASMVDQDMAHVGFELHPVDILDSGWYLEKGCPIPLQYSIADPRWDVDHPAKQKAMEGGFLTHGDFAYLSKCCQLGRSLLPDMWPSKFSADLCHPERHLDVLNEVWWLGRFLHARSIAYEPSHNGGKRPDWTFTCGAANEDLKLCVEIKRRPATTRIHIGQDAQIDIFRDIIDKFESAPLGHLRVACITVYCPMDRAFQERCCAWLRDNCSAVDALLCFSFASDNTFPFYVAPLRLEKLLSRLVLRTLDYEDENFIGVVQHPLNGITPSDYAARDGS